MPIKKQEFSDNMNVRIEESLKQELNEYMVEHSEIYGSTSELMRAALYNFIRTYGTSVDEYIRTIILFEPQHYKTRMQVVADGVLLLHEKIIEKHRKRRENELLRDEKRSIQDPGKAVEN